MARITEEQKELINELYAEIGVKSQVAKIVGCSPASVSKYLIPDYIPKVQRIKIVFEGKPNDCSGLIAQITDKIAQGIPVNEVISGIFSMNDNEKEDLETLKKEIF